MRLEFWRFFELREIPIILTMMISDVTIAIFLIFSLSELRHFTPASTRISIAEIMKAKVPPRLPVRKRAEICKMKANVRPLNLRYFLLEIRKKSARVRQRFMARYALKWVPWPMVLNMRSCGDWLHSRAKLMRLALWSKPKIAIEVDVTTLRTSEMRISRFWKKLKISTGISSKFKVVNSPI